MAENERIFVGRAKYMETKYGEMCKVWLTPEGIESINANVDNKGGINLVMTEMRNPDRANNTHVLYIDDWKPSRQGTSRSHGGHAPQRREPQRRERDQDDDRRRNYGGRNDGGFGGQSGDSGGHRYSQEDCPRQQQEPPPMDEDVGAPPFDDEDIPF